MQRHGALFAVCFVAGLLAGLAQGLFVWACGNWGVTALLGVRLAPALELSWFYPLMIWGGLFGLPYYFSIARLRNRRHWIRKGLWFSLIPTAVMLGYFFPYVRHQGQAGLSLGTLTPMFVTVANLIWGVFLGFFTRLIWGR